MENKKTASNLSKLPSITYYVVDKGNGDLQIVDKLLAHEVAIVQGTYSRCKHYINNNTNI